MKDDLPPASELLHQVASDQETDENLLTINQRVNLNIERLRLLSESTRANRRAQQLRLRQEIRALRREHQHTLKLNGLTEVNDWLPFPKLRKQNRKMLADQQAHIAHLVQQKRYRAAKFNVVGTWMLWAWYVLKWPIVSASKAIFGKA